MYEKYAALRDERHMNDAEVAREAGVPQSTLSEWKSGMYTPKVDKLMKIAKLFEVPIDELLKKPQ